MSRKEITAKLTEAATHYFVKKMYSVHREIGLKNGGHLRADLLALNMKKQLIIVEVKSCWSDYKSDTKWIKYLPFADKIYFCISQDLWESKHGKQIAKDVKEHGVGILVLMENGKISAKKNAKSKSVDDNFKEWLMLKLAWRGGDSRHNIKRFKRVYL